MLLLLFACVPAPAPRDTAPPPAPPVGPDIAVDSLVVDLGRARLDEPLTGTLTVTNAGDLPLALATPILDDPTGEFTLGGPAAATLAAGASVVFDLTFGAGAIGASAARILLPSDDPDEPLLTLDLRAHVGAPALALDPPALDFGTIDARCSETRAVTVRNDGDDPLVVTDLTIDGGDATFDVDLADAGPLPWTIAPGEAATVDVHFTPPGAPAYAASLVVRSNDPLNPVAAVTLDGVATDNERVTDTFITFGKALDVVIAVGGADTDALATALLEALPALTGPLQAANADYQVAAIRADDGCLVNGLLPEETMTDDEGAAALTLLLATSGTEHTLALLERAIIESTVDGCNPDLARTRATMAVVGLTDSAAPAPQAHGVYTRTFEGTKTDPDDVSAWVIAPDGTSCGVRDDAWDLVVTATGGGYLSACDDLATNLATVAEAALVRQETWPLSRAPWPDTLAMAVAGEVTTAWTFDATTNEITFPTESLPRIGDMVRVTYDAVPACAAD